MSVRHYLDLAGARVVQTEALLLTERSVCDLLAAEAMGVLHGRAGSGKTFAAQLALAQHSTPRCWVAFPSRPTMLHVARRLVGALTGQLPRRANRFDLSDELIELLGDQPRLIVVDEAQWLNRECIEYLRHLHDHPDTRFALLLIGGDGCGEVLSREPMLRSRIYRRVRFTAMTIETVLAAIPGHHPIYETADPELLVLIDDSYAHGSFREWASFTHSAAQLCREHDAPGLSPAMVHAALEMHAGHPIDRAA